MEKTYIKTSSKILIISTCLIALVLTSCERKSVGLASKSTDGETYQLAYAGNSDESYVTELSPLANSGPDGEALYKTHCAACHQQTGMGLPGAFPPLVGSDYVVGDNIERMASIMLYGLQGPITVNGTEYNSVMAPLGPTLKDDELAAVATYVRSAWGNTAGEVKTETFTKMREKWGTRSMFKIEELN